MAIEVPRAKFLDKFPIIYPVVLINAPVELIFIILFPVVILLARIDSVPETPNITPDEARVKPLLLSTVREVKAPVGVVVEFLNTPEPLIVCAFVITYPIPPNVNV